MGFLQTLIIPLLFDEKKFKESGEKVKNQADKVTNGLSKIGGIAVTAGIGAVTAGLGAMTAGLVASVNATQDWGNKLDSTMDILGGTSKEAAGLNVMMERIGGSADDVSSAMKKMTMGLVATNGELGPTGLALQKLGINAYDTNGQIKNAYELFEEVANATANMDDGLEKSGLLMDIFGKSGAELGDALSAAASGGMTEFQNEAEKLGLVLDPSTIIEQQKSQAKLDQTLQGLQITAGSILIPVLSELATSFQKLLIDPAIKQSITDLVTLIANFSLTIISHIPQAIQTFQTIVDWLSNNQGIIIGVLSAIGVAIGYFVYTSVIPPLIAAATAFYTTFAPVIAIIAAVGVAAYLLYQIWDHNFFGIRTALTNLWEKIKPIFTAVYEWLKTNIPVAIQAVSDFWTNTLIPALKKVYDWLYVNVFPLFRAIGNFLGAVFGKIIEALAGLWQNVLYPALQKVWEFLNDKIFPIFKKVGEWVKEKLSPAFEWLGDVLWEVAKFFNKLAYEISKLKLPDWLTPGSPTPLEIGLWGINDALKKVGGNTLPKFSTEVDIQGVISKNGSSVSGNDNSNLIPYLQEIASKEGFDNNKLALLLGNYIAQGVG